MQRNKGAKNVGNKEYRNMFGIDIVRRVLQTTTCLPVTGRCTCPKHLPKKPTAPLAFSPPGPKTPHPRGAAPSTWCSPSTPPAWCPPLQTPSPSPIAHSTSQRCCRVCVGGWQTWGGRRGTPRPAAGRSRAGSWWRTWSCFVQRWRRNMRQLGRKRRRSRLLLWSCRG